MISGEHKQELEQTASNWLVKLQSPELSEAQEKAFFAWLEASPMHQAAYIRAEQIWERGQVLQQLQEPKHNNVVHVNFRRWSYMAAAACVLCFVFLGVKFYSGATNSDFNALYATNHGEQQTLTLNDGSELILNTNTSIEVSLSDGHRKVTLHKGEVFFKVAKDPQRPFDVLADTGSVRVLGTQFSVYHSTKDTTVTVLEGLVGLRAEKSLEKKPDKDEASFKADVTLSADQQLSLREAANKLSPRKVDAKTALSWRSKSLIFRGEALEDVIASLNRYFDKQLILGDPELANMEVIAVVQISDFENALATLEQSLQLQSHQADNGQSVTLKKASN